LFPRPWAQVRAHKNREPKIAKILGNSLKKAASFLKESTKKWVNALTRIYELEERHIRILNLAGECWDRLAEIREILKAEGYQVTDRFGQNKAHPLLAEERAQKKLFAQLIRELGLDLEDTEIPRIPTR